LSQPAPVSGSLEVWAKRGVLLLNTSLTVEDGQPASHAKRGWEPLTDALLTEVARTVPACVYMLWGGHAQAKAELIERETCAQPTGFLGLRGGAPLKREALVLKANHPSPLSALRPTAFHRLRSFFASQGLVGAEKPELGVEFVSHLGPQTREYPKTLL